MPLKDIKKRMRRAVMADDGGGGKTKEEEAELGGPIFPDLFVYMIWILSTEFAVDSMRISTLLQFFVTVGYEGRAVEHISNKKRTVFTIALPVVSVAGTFETINAS